MTNILDLRKGDTVIGGLEHNGDEFGRYLGRKTVFKVCSITLSNDAGYYSQDTFVTVHVRLRKANSECVIYADKLFDGKIYLTSEDFFAGRFIPLNLNISDIRMMLATKFGLQQDEYGIPIVWWWDSENKCAKTRLWATYYDLADPKIPDGCYATKSECEKANRKMVTIEVTHTFMTQREEGEDAEHLLNNPDEYEFMDGDECISDARYAD